MPRPMTMAEKILQPMQGLEVSLATDRGATLTPVLSNDVTAPIAIKEFKKIGGKGFRPYQDRFGSPTTM